MKQKLLSLGLSLMAAAMLLTGCGAEKKELSRYQVTFLSLFDTVTTVTGYAENEDAFHQTVSAVFSEMETCDHLYDIYHEYPGIVNLCTVNSHPGETFTVDQRIIDLLLIAREADLFSGHRTDAMLGAVLKLWHNAREYGIAHPDEAFLPDADALREAAAHTGFSLLEIDPEARTVRLTDPEASLDVGALAKGYTVERVCKTLPSGYLLSAGGNVAASGPKPDGSAWTIGIQNPDTGDSSFLHKVSLEKGAVVTSGDYQRLYTVDGTAYHHIIDPDTLFPGNRWRAVTVMTEDSGLADALSTSLFLMDQEEGQRLLDQYGAVAMWVSRDGSQLFSPGYEKRIRP